jgi:hypothetical protein
MRFARSRETKTFLFASFRFKFFASDRSEISTAYFRFVSLSKIFRFLSETILQEAAQIINRGHWLAVLGPKADSSVPKTSCWTRLEQEYQWSISKQANNW